MGDFRHALIPVPLSDIPTGHQALLVANELGGLLGERLSNLGFTEGTRIRVLRRGPKDVLVAVVLRDTTVAIRSDSARALLVTS